MYFTENKSNYMILQNVTAAYNFKKKKLGCGKYVRKICPLFNEFLLCINQQFNN